jgi:predicted nuclease of restriction endonuclease-like (RecB) superfamily
MKLDKTYKDWLIALKGKIRSSQLKAALAINAELINLYWELGKMITEKQTAWGTGFLEQLSKDLCLEFPEMKGFSYRNLAMCRQFYQFYQFSILQQPVAELDNSSSVSNRQQPVAKLETNSEFGQQLVAQIPWGHNI